jgi:hypothetical protein
VFVTVLLMPLIMSIETTVLNILKIKLTPDKFTARYCGLSLQVTKMISVPMVIVWVVL